MALETTGAYMPQDKIDSKNITELSDILEQMRSKIESSDTKEHYKEVLYSYVDEMVEGIINLDIGGVDAFTSKVEIANGKVVLYSEAFMHSGFSETIKKIYELSTKIINDAQVWAGALGFISGKFLG